MVSLTPNPSQPADKEMKPERFDQLLGALNGLGTKSDTISCLSLPVRAHCGAARTAGASETGC